jgi:hypothetical protein
MLGTAELHSGEPGGLERLREAFEAAPAARPRADVARTLAPVLAAQGHFEEAVARLGAAIAALPSDEGELRLHLEAEVTSAARLFPATYARAGERLRALAEEAKGETPGRACCSPAAPSSSRSTVHRPRRRARSQSARLPQG